MVHLCSVSVGNVHRSGIAGSWNIHMFNCSGGGQNAPDHGTKKDRTK